MDRTEYKLVPGPYANDDDGSWLIVHDGEMYAELIGTQQVRAQRIVDALNATQSPDAGALAERVRMVNEVRAFAEQVRHESLTGPITAGIIDQVADRINTLKEI